MPSQERQQSPVMPFAVSIMPAFPFLVEFTDFNCNITSSFPEDRDDKAAIAGGSRVLLSAPIRGRRRARDCRGLAWQALQPNKGGKVAFTYDTKSRHYTATSTVFMYTENFSPTVVRTGTYHSSTVGPSGRFFVPVVYRNLIPRTKLTSYDRAIMSCHAPFLLSTNYSM